MSDDGRADTVAARMTPPGTAALATLAITGPGCIAIAKALFRSHRGAVDLASDVGPHYGDFGNDPSDDVVLALTDSDPGCLTVEVHSHGGIAIVDALLAQIERQGAAIVPWQELLRRRGMSEIQIEATEALGMARTPKSAGILLDQLHGSLDEAFLRIMKEPSRSAIDSLLGWADLGMHLTHPWRVMFLGRPNVGKSSLLNAIVGFERAIVSAIPGTTRDVLEGEASIDGWPVLLTDGAGIRETDVALERDGIGYLRRHAEGVDLRIHVRDLSSEPSPEDDRIAAELSPDFVIGNKCDLPSPWNDEEQRIVSVRVSAHTGEAIATLLDMISKRLVPRVPARGEAVPFTERQRLWLMEKRESASNSSR